MHETKGSLGKGYSHVILILLFLLLLTTFSYVTICIFGSYEFAFHSDDAIKTVLARLALNGGSLVSHKWVYANGDLFLASPYIFSVIIFPFLGISYFSNALASWLAYLFLTITVYGVCHHLAPNRPRAAIIAATLAAGGISAANFEFVVAQGAYSIYAALALCLFSLAAVPSHAINMKSKISIVPLAGLAAALVCISNSTRGDITIVFPLIVGWLFAVLLLPCDNIEQRFLRMRNVVVYAIVVGAVFGTIVYKYFLLKSVYNYEAAARIGFASISEMREHLLKLPSAWFSYFLVGGSWQSPSVALKLLQFFVWLIAATLVLAPLCVMATRRWHTHALVTLSCIVVACYGVSFAAMVVSPSLFSSSLDMRYATFPIYGSLCIVAILADQSTIRLKSISAVALVALGVIGVWTGSLWHRAYAPNTTDAGGISYAQRMTLIRALEKDGVGTVLATYWHSHVLTVLSGGSVDSYPVAVGNMLHPFPHHMPKLIFYGTAGVKQAVVLSDNESTPQAWEAVEYQLGPPIAKRLIGPFAVWIYDSNITQAVLETGEEVDAPIPKNELSIRISRSQFPSCAANKPCEVWIDVTNTGRHALASVGSLPLRLGVHGLDSDGHIVVQDAGRADFPSVILPGKMTRVRLSLPSSAKTGVAAFQVCLLQEGVNWLCDRTVAAQPTHG